MLLLLLLLLRHICTSDARSSLVQEMSWRPFGAKPLPGTIPRFRDNWFKTQGYFIIKQNETNILSSTIYLKTNKNTTTTQSVCEPLSEPMMARCALEIPKFKHDTFGKRAFAVCGPLSWLCDEIETFKRTLKTHPFVKFVNESTLAI